MGVAVGSLVGWHGNGTSLIGVCKSRTDAAVKEAKLALIVSAPWQASSLHWTSTCTLTFHYCHHKPTSPSVVSMYVTASSKLVTLCLLL